MQTMSARDAQTKFGQFSREAQRDTVVVTNHGQPVFLTIPVKITASVARMIREVSPKDGAEASQTLQDFFAHLNATQPANPQLDEAKISRMIKQGDNE
jgi:prevent-host-death family protein